MMRKFLFVALVSSALVVGTPASALARHHHRHHHSRIRHEHFGTATTTSGGMQGAAGTVDSFMNGVLTIKLNDTNGTLVSGMVTSETELKCEAPENEVNDNDGDDSSFGGQIAMDDGGGTSGSDDSSSDDGSADDNLGGDEQMCSTANLTPGTVVQDAELDITSAGAVWHEVELVLP